jgi:hypothetical protein
LLLVATRLEWTNDTWGELSRDAYDERC